MKKIKLGKKTITNLSEEQMDNIRGASVAHPSCVCDLTTSCTFAHECCIPPEVEKVINLENVC